MGITQQSDCAQASQCMSNKKMTLRHQQPSRTIFQLTEFNRTILFLALT